MKKFKKRLGAVLAALMMVFTCFSSMPALAAEALPRITFVGVEHSPLMVGDTETFTLTSVNADKVQYRAFIYTEAENKWEEITDGYTEAVDSNLPYVIKPADKFQKGKYKLSFWVKRAGMEGKHTNKNGDYDSFYTVNLNCVEKTEPATRIYVDGEMDIARDAYIVGQKVVINGIKNMTGMPGPYKYKLHLFNNGKYGVKDKNWDGKGWFKDATEYGDKIEWTPTEAGNYVLDVWVKAEASKAKFQSWKLKTITVLNGTVLSKNGEVFGSEDANNPKVIEDNLYVGADKVTLKNLKVNGTIFVDPGKDGETYLDNVQAGSIKILSGGKNSIHLKNVKSNELAVKSSEYVRVVFEGTTELNNTKVSSYAILDNQGGKLGNIVVSENEYGETVVELRGTFNETIVVEGAATIKAAAGASVAKVEIATSSKDDKVVLDGRFNDVVVNKEATLSLAENTQVTTLTTNANTSVEAAKGASVTTVNDNGNTVDKSGEGKNNIGQTTTGGGYYPPAPSDAALKQQISIAITELNKIQSIKNNIEYAFNSDSRTMTVKVINLDRTISDLYDTTIAKISDENIDKAVTLLDILFKSDIKVGSESFKAYAVKKLTDNDHGYTANLINSGDYKTVINNLKSKPYAEMKFIVYPMLNFDKAEVVICGLRLNSVKVGDKSYNYATGKDSVSAADIMTAFGIDSVGSTTLGKLVGKTAIVDIGGFNYTIEFTK